MFGKDSLNDRIFNLEDAVEYLSERVGEKVFVNDLIKLILEGRLRPSCYLSSVFLAEVIKYQTGTESLSLATKFNLSEWAYCDVTYESGKYHEHISAINVLNLQSEFQEDLTARIYSVSPNPFFKLKERLMESHDGKLSHSETALYTEKLKNSQFHTGTFELEMTKEVSRWFTSIHAGTEPYDIEELYFTDNDGQRFKRVYSNESHQFGFKAENPSVTRLKLSDIKIQELHLNELIKAPKHGSSEGNDLTSFMKQRVDVAKRYVEERSEEQIRALTTYEIWHELWALSSELVPMHSQYNADEIFDQSLSEDSMIRGLSALRSAGVSIPKRKRKSRKKAQQ
jgi:hypothetical protein